MIISDLGKVVLGWEKHVFSIECDRAKCNERIGGSGIENGLTV